MVEEIYEEDQEECKRKLDVQVKTFEDAEDRDKYVEKLTNGTMYALEVSAILGISCAAVQEYMRRNGITATVVWPAAPVQVSPEGRRMRQIGG
ncbi:MAG: hypothetical protein GIS02_06270 [Methanosarcinales archaeon]|uniref:Uncharacterized protein n=1 Tax=Candidatus Ethanoperedens thermophilum TaxID=2766897 RepID=A0A848DAK5_9EURY|nr:hypothetical protein [Candidatus Ethanoperedens thermophilum]